MKNLSDAIREGRNVHPPLQSWDRRLSEFNDLFGEGEAPLNFKRSSLFGAALVGALGAAAAFRVARQQPGESPEVGARQIVLILKGLFPILAQKTLNPLNGEEASIREILNKLSASDWTESEIVRWLAAFENGTHIQSFNGLEFIETVEADGSRNRFYPGNKVILRESVGHENPPVYTVFNLFHGGELGLQIGTATVMRIGAEMVVNHYTPARTLMSFLPKQVLDPEKETQNQLPDEAVIHGNYLPFTVGNKKFFDIESAVAAAFVDGTTIVNGFGKLAKQLNDEASRIPRLTSREIIYSNFFEVSGDFFPAAAGVLPNRDDFDTDEAFEAALITAYQTAYPESDAARFSICVASTEGYGFKDGDGNWQVFESYAEAIDSLASESTKLEIRLNLAKGETPNLLVQDAEIAPLKVGDRWVWTVDRIKGDIYHDGFEVPIALRLSSPHRHELIFD